MKSEKTDNTAGTESLSGTIRQQMMDHIATSPYGKENFTSPKDREYITKKKKI